MLTALLPILWIAACGEGPALAPTQADDLGDPMTLAAMGEKGRRSVTADTPRGILGNSLPGGWRPFADDSPWNTPIPADAATHPSSDLVIGFMASEKGFIRASREYTIPVWIVDTERMEMPIVRSDRIYDDWDADRDGWSDVGAPLHPSMWWEATSDGHICVLDPARNLAWEMSRFDWLSDGTPTCTTFNVWDLTGAGHGDHNEGDRWQLRGGRGSGFPLIAGLVRPEEVRAGEIRHALVFTFSEVRMSDEGWDMFVAPPACRGDGNMVGDQYPIEGMRLQLNPELTESDFDEWGLTEEAKVMARALQTYGMYLCDRGGDMAIQVQLLSDRPALHRSRWEDRLPGFFKSIEKIRTDQFRVVDQGEVVVKD